MPDQSQFGMLIDPQDYAQALRQMGLSQTLTGEALAPLQAPQTQSVRGLYVQPRTSPVSALSKLAEAYMGNKSYQQGIGAQSRYAQALMGAGQGYLDTATGNNGQPSNYGTRMEALTRASQFGLVPEGQAKQIGEQIAAENKPGDLDATLRGAGIMPGTPEYQAVMAQAGKKAIYTPPAEIRPGNIALDVNNKPIVQNPQRQFEPNPAMPGTGTWQTAPAVAGVPSPAEAAQGGPNAAPGAPAAAPAAPAPTTKHFPLNKPGSYTAADLEAQKKGAESGQNYAMQLEKNSTNSVEVLRSLSELRNLANQSGVNVANPAKLELGSYMVAAGMDPKTVGSMLHTDVGALTAASKQTGSLALDSIHSMTSRGTNFDLQTFMRYNPNLNMATPEGFNRVLDFMSKRMQEEVAKHADFAQYSQTAPPNRWAIDHPAQWNQKQVGLINSGATNSANPNVKYTASKPLPNGKMAYQINGKWFDNPDGK